MNKFYLHTSVAMALCLALPVLSSPVTAQDSAPPLLPALPMIAAQVVGSGETGQQSQDAPAIDFLYKIGPEDVFEITVRDEDLLSREITVRPDGYITMPLIGDIRAVGLRIDQLNTKLVDAYSRFIKDPHINIRAIRTAGTYQDRIRIIGSAMSSPTSVPYREDHTALSVLTEIGGIPKTAAANRAFIIRKTNGEERQIPLNLGDIQSGREITANPKIEPGDVIVIPESFLAGERNISPTLSVVQSYSDNLNLRQTDKQGSFITEIVPAVRLDYDTARIRAAVDGALRFQYRTNTDDEFSFAPDINATANIEIAESFFFTDLAASVTRQLTDTRRGQSSTISNIANTQTVQTYKVSPYFLNRLGQVATLETRYRGGLVLMSQAEPDPLNPGFPGGRPATDTFENTGIITLGSQTRGSNLDWRITGQHSHFDQSDRPNRERKEVIADIDYALTHSLTLLLRGGYQKFSGQGFGREVDDPLYMGGIRWSPSIRTILEITGGQLDGRSTVRGFFSKMIGSTLVFDASYEERLRLDQERLLDELPTSPDQLDPTRPPGLPFSLRSTPTRTKTAQATLRGTFDVNSITLHGSWQSNKLEASNDSDDKEDVIIARINFSRPISRDVSFNSFASYTEREFSAQDLNGSPRTDKDYRANVGLNYLGFRQLILSLNYGISKRDSNISFQNFTENSISLSATMRF